MESKVYVEADIAPWFGYTTSEVRGINPEAVAAILLLLNTGEVIADIVRQSNDERNVFLFTKYVYPLEDLAEKIALAAIINK